jgi:aspartate aminotransferase
MPELAHGAHTMPRSGIREVMDLAWSLAGPVLGLHVGEPSFAPPEHVIAAARAAYADGQTHYVPNAGIAELRAALAEKVRTENQLAADPAQIVVSAGGAQALHVAFSLTVSAGDEVLVPDPGWPNFAMAVQLLQGIPVRYPLPSARDFRPDTAALDQLVTERTKAIVVNSPSNPLGSVLPPADIAALVRFAERHDLWLISDECYDALAYDDAEQTSPGQFDTDGRVLSVFSFSKTYAMTGVRVGYLVAPEPVAAQAAKLQEAVIACVNAPAQAAALAALRGPQDAVHHMRETYRQRRDAALEALDTEKLGYLVPRGAFYLWVDVRERTDDVAGWALRLLREQSVAVAPGTAFGPGGQGWIRLSLATDTGDLLEGVRRIGAMT